MSSASAMAGSANCLRSVACYSIPLDFISAVQACTNASTSSGTTVLLFHVDWNFGCCGITGPASAAVLFFDAGCAPLFLNRENSGIVNAVWGSLSLGEAQIGWQSKGGGCADSCVVNKGGRKERGGEEGEDAVQGARVENAKSMRRASRPNDGGSNA